MSRYRITQFTSACGERGGINILVTGRQTFLRFFAEKYLNYQLQCYYFKKCCILNFKNVKMSTHKNLYLFQVVIHDLID